MGTNYYLHVPRAAACPHCGRSDDTEILHIGKSSAGWVFSLHVIPEQGIHDLDDWRARWPRGRIVDECGDSVSIEQMEATITRRKNKPFSKQRWTGWYADEADFHAKNQSLRGPNGLLRHQIGRHCIKHGAGTWDCMVGEFS
jgi:hypothetical protein